MAWEAKRRGTQWFLDRGVVGVQIVYGTDARALAETLNAADAETERLRARVAELEAALAPFADVLVDGRADEYLIGDLKQGDFRRAADVLAGKSDSAAP